MKSTIPTYWLRPGEIEEAIERFNQRFNKEDGTVRTVIFYVDGESIGPAELTACIIMNPAHPKTITVEPPPKGRTNAQED